MKVKWFDRFLKDPEAVTCGCEEDSSNGVEGLGFAPDPAASRPVLSTGDSGSSEKNSGCGGASVCRSNDPKMMRELARIKLEDIPTAAGPVPRVSARLRWTDRIGSWKARWGIGRMDFRIPPGLYSLGNADGASPVFVTANYKMSFDRLRSELESVVGWILVLDTKGINVWCAAGKGTFGTEELVARIADVSLDRVVEHRELILPQLGAPGIAAHEVKKRTGFRVIYGPVKASDLPEFLQSGNRPTPEMRRVRFPFKERAALAPVELAGILRHPITLALLAVWFVSLMGIKFLYFDFPALIGAVVVGVVLVPLFLPWIPVRPFALKGWIVGLLWAAAAFALHSRPEGFFHNWLEGISYFLVLPALSAFLAMNFTGSSTITCLSGVVKEMRTAVPLILGSLALGFGAGLAGVIFL